MVTPYEAKLCTACPFCIEEPGEPPRCRENQDPWGNYPMCAHVTACHAHALTDPDPADGEPEEADDER